MLYAKTLVDSADNVSLKEWKLTALGSTVGNLDCSAGNSLSKFLVSWHNRGWKWVGSLTGDEMPNCPPNGLNT